jgi:hypothetical protein
MFEPDVGNTQVLLMYLGWFTFFFSLVAYLVKKNR